MKPIILILALLLAMGAVITSASAKYIRPSTDPQFQIQPSRGDFFSMNTGETYLFPYRITNGGDQPLVIHKIGVEGEGFALVDDNRYPFEVLGTVTGNVPTGPTGKVLSVSIRFSPEEVREYTGRLLVYYGTESDQVFEMPLNGLGISCANAIEGHLGENWVPRFWGWVSFTADKFGVYQFNACHPNQTTQGNDSWDLGVIDYEDCNGTYTSTEYYFVCPYDKRAPYESTVLEPGQTVYLFWFRYNPSNPHNQEGFYFNIVETYIPPEGDICENAVPLTLPVVNRFGNTRELHDDYTYSPCSPFTNYLDGNDMVYRIHLEEEGYLVGDIIGAYASIHVLSECPKEELPKDRCKAFTGGPRGGQFRRRIEAGDYYVVVSNWTPVQSIDYVMNLSFQGLSEAEIPTLENELTVFPNPVSDKLVILLNRAEPEEITLELISPQGSVVYRSKFNAGALLHEEIDTGSLAPGLYLLRLSSNNEVIVKRVVRGS